MQYSGLMASRRTQCMVPLVALLWFLNAWPACSVMDGTKQVINRPQPPTFPDAFFMKYTFSMPHFYLTQPKGLKYPVSVWFDGPNNLRRVDAYDGEDSCVSVEGVDYTVIPRIDKLQCDVWGAPGRQVFSPLPDLYLWEYGGSVDLEGRLANIWQRQIKEGDKVSQYTFYITPDGVPIRMAMIGVNYLTNAHFDEYLYDFTHFQVGLPNNTAQLFAVPSICQQQLAATAAAAADVGTSSSAGPARQHPAAWQLGALLPDVRAYDDNHAYLLWTRAHGRVHTDANEYDARLERFRVAVQRVQAHNARPDRSYSLRLNQWADWHEQEFRDVMLPNSRLGTSSSRAGESHLQSEKGSATADVGAEGPQDILLSELPGAYRPMGHFTATLQRNQLPTAVDWRGTGADPGIKDQAMCGSCYAFASTGAMDGAWFVATGERRSFSEQQIVDCAWDYGPNGCFGGYYQPVFNYVAESGGIALEQDYTYRGEVGYCRSGNHSRVGRFSGYLAVESRNELALMEAVWKFGPVAVSVDAGPDSFRFYSEGVYDEPQCSHKMADLDHTVTLFGYGTTPEGKDYWLVRNSWAKFYGEDGYIRIARGRRDCGIATDPAVPVVVAELVVPEAQEAAWSAAARWAAA